MPETRSTFDWSQLLDGVDRDLADEYNGIMDVVEQAKDKYSALWRRAEAVMAHLIRNKAELDRITALRQKEQTEHEEAIEISRKKLRAQVRKLRKCRRENDSLRRRNRHLEGDLSAAKEELRKVDHLRCEICYDKIRNRFTKCGHTFCDECLFMCAQHSVTKPDPGPCPTCRAYLRAEDVKEIFLEGGPGEVVVVDDSDSNSDND